METPHQAFLQRLSWKDPQEGSLAHMLLSLSLIHLPAPDSMPGRSGGHSVKDPLRGNSEEHNSLWARGSLAVKGCSRAELNALGPGWSLRDQTMQVLTWWLAAAEATHIFQLPDFSNLASLLYLLADLQTYVRRLKSSVLHSVMDIGLWLFDVCFSWASCFGGSSGSWQVLLFWIPACG